MTRYSIELIPADRGWILEKMASEIQKLASATPALYRAEIRVSPSGTADLTYFLPESAYRDVPNTLAVTYLAHKENHPGAAKLFEQVARKSDYCITSSTKYKRVLERDGAKKVFKIPLGVDTSTFVPRIRIGVVGRTYPTGRKGEHLLTPALSLPHVEFVFTGDGWPSPARYYEQRDLVALYQSLDYLLVPSLIEGGPVPMLEALSSACPVIAPSDIGMVTDFPHIPFRRGNAADLKRTIEAEIGKRLSLRKSVLAYDWTAFAQRHLDLFKRLIDERRIRPVTTVPRRRRAPRILLITHGSELHAKGGPTTRARQIVDQLQSRGRSVDIAHNPSSALVDSYDVLHVFNIWPPHSAIGTLSAAKRSGKTVVFSPIALDLSDWPLFHPFTDLLLDSKPSNPQLRAALRRIRAATPPRRYSSMADVPIEGVKGHFEALRICCDLADRLIFLSAYERQFLRTIGARTNHGDLIPNGIDVDTIRNATPEAFRRQFGFDRYFLTVGRIEQRKNQATIALAMRDIDLPLVIIGAEGDPNYAKHVRRLGGRKVHMLGRIDDRDLLASAYAGAEALLFPTWTEGAPLAALEAGAAGTPLILSCMSSEREYFAADARYVHPADVVGIREAARSIADSGEAPSRRARRAKRVADAYDIKQHADSTYAVYERAFRAGRTAATKRPVVLEVSALVHFLRVGRPLTGVPTVEWNMLQELRQLDPALRCIVYNDVKDRFVRVLTKDIEKFNESTFNTKYWFGESVDQSGTDRESFLATETAPPGKDNANLPTTGKTTVRFRHALGTVVLRDSPRWTPVAPVGARLLSLGQSWISNEPMLKKLTQLTHERALSLEPYVFDLTYHTGAHFSGFADNDNRYRRLLHLLEHSQHVYTEGRQVEHELQKLKAARGLSFMTHRTLLRGRNLPIPTAASAPKYPSNEFVLYVSSFNKRKNHDFLVHVWRELYETHLEPLGKEFRLVLVGETQENGKYGDAQFKEVLRKWAIDVYHHLTDEALSHLMHSCAFTVYPSVQEGWGMPVQESLLCGKVCLVSETLPVAQEIQNAALVRLSPWDYYGWYESIKTWLNNPTMRQAFGKEARRYRPPSWRSIAGTIFRAHK